MGTFTAEALKFIFVRSAMFMFCLIPSKGLMNCDHRGVKLLKQSYDCFLACNTLGNKTSHNRTSTDQLSRHLVPTTFFY